MPSRRSSDTDLRVVAHRPRRERIIAAGIVVGALALGALGYVLGLQQGADERDAALLELDVLTEDHRALRDEHARMERQLNDERLARQVRGVSSDEVRDTLTEQASTIARLEEQIRFYENLMAGDGDGELQIAELELLERLDGRGVRFQLLLVRAADRREEVTGHVRLRVVGARDGEPAVLSGEMLGTDLDAPIPFRFRYFQRLAGEIRLPEGFVPQGVEIVATSEDDGFNLQRTFSWELQEA